HGLTADARKHRREVSAEGPGREVVLLVPAGAPRAGAVGGVAYRPEADEPGFILLTVTPPAITGRSLPRDLTFVVDVSGSMRAGVIDRARAAVDRLPPPTRPDAPLRV